MARRTGVPVSSKKSLFKKLLSSKLCLFYVGGLLLISLVIYYGGSYYRASILVKEADALMKTGVFEIAIEKYTMASTTWSPYQYKVEIIQPRLASAVIAREDRDNFNKGIIYFQNSNWKDAIESLSKVSKNSNNYIETKDKLKTSVNNLADVYSKDLSQKIALLPSENQTETYIVKITEVVNEYVKWGEDISDVFSIIAQNTKTGNYDQVVESLTAQSNRFRSMFLSASGITPPENLRSAHDHFVQALINSHVWLSMWADSITELKYGNTERSKDSMSQANAYKTEAKNEMTKFQETWNKIKL